MGGFLGTDSAGGFLGPTLVAIPGGGGVGGLMIDDPDQHYVTGLSEQVVTEISVPFALLPAGNLKPVLALLSAQTGDASGTYRVRVGGTVSAADGIVVAALGTTHGSYPSTPDQDIGASFPNPSAPTLVKITAAVSAAGERARVRGSQVVFVTA